MDRSVGVARLFLFAAIALLPSLSTTPIEAAPEPPRSLAILEVRAGSAAAPDIGTRIAQALTTKTGLAVMAPAAARQEVGPSLDASVKSCAGDAKCIAALGIRLGVDEVILIGISELGDVILTMQRVVVASAEVAGTVAETISADTPPTDDEIERYLRQLLPNNDFQQWGQIRVETNVEAATVEIDGEAKGRTPLAPLTVSAPADYNIAVAKDGYSEFRARIAVTPGAMVVVNPELSPIPRDAWYKKWWVVAIAGGVTAAAVTTAIVLNRDGPSDVPVMIDPF